MVDPTIVAVAYNRPASLARLLASLDRAHYETKATLIISIDKGDNQDVRRLAEDFTWRHGEKRVIYQEKNLGLREHILKCGDLTAEYGSVIVLEDDLYVSPVFYQYSRELMTRVADKPEIAGISLYSPRLNQNAVLPFQALDDANDVFFCQWASSWGQAWNERQWSGFRAWYAENSKPLPPNDRVPVAIIRWPNRSWLKYFIKYCVVTTKFVVYPRESYTTNFGDVGTNAPRASQMLQSPLQLFKTNLRSGEAGDSQAVYDGWLEIIPDRLKMLSPGLRDFDFAVDLYATKRRIDVTNEYVLTSRPARNPVRTFALAMKPMEMNVIEDVRGHGLSLCRADDVQWDSDEASKRLYEFFYPELSAKRLAKMAWSRAGRSLRRRFGREPDAL